MLKSWSAAKKCPLGQRLRGCCQPAGRPRQLSSVIVPTTGHGLEQGCSPVNLARRSGCRPEACKTNCFRTQVGQVFVQKKQKKTKNKSQCTSQKGNTRGLALLSLPTLNCPTARAGGSGIHTEEGPLCCPRADRLSFPCRPSARLQAAFSLGLAGLQKLAPGLPQSYSRRTPSKRWCWPRGRAALSLQAQGTGSAKVNQMRA